MSIPKIRTYQPLVDQVLAAGHVAAEIVDGVAYAYYRNWRFEIPVDCIDQAGTVFLTIKPIEPTVHWYENLRVAHPKDALVI